MAVVWKIKEKALAQFEDTENQRKENNIYLPSYWVEISLIMSTENKMYTREEWVAVCLN